MSATRKPGPHAAFGSPIAIGAVVGTVAGAFTYTAGWLSPDRLMPSRMLSGFGPTTLAKLGHRRNHAKGVCFTGRFEANGAGTALSRATVFAAGVYPVVGRFNLGAPNPQARDGAIRLRGLSIQVKPPGGQKWRSGMINAPVFAVFTPRAFYARQVATGSKDPDAMRAFVAANPEFRPFGAWAKTGPWTGSYAEERYNGLDAFRLIDADGAVHAVRWSLLPAAAPVIVDPATVAAGGADQLEYEITERVQNGPVRWTMRVTVADPGDPTADPSRPWPADRRTVDIGTLVVDRVQPEADGPCRDVNYDPTILPDGISTSDDPFPAAHSAVYASSYDRRAAEASDYPRTVRDGGGRQAAMTIGVTAIPPRFTPLQRALHWSMAVLVLAMLFIGVGMVATVSRSYLTLVSIHKPLGLAILLLVLVRIGVRLWRGAPPLPSDLPGPMRAAAHLSHYAFYALMLAMPLLGWGMLSAAAYPVQVLGHTLPPMLPQSDALHSLLWTAHRTLAFAFFALILLHLSAALFHALIRRDGVFGAMAPVLDRSVATPAE